MGTAGAALVLACAGFVGTDLVVSRRAHETDLSVLADVVGFNSAAALMFHDARSASNILGALHAQPSIIAARLYTNDGLPIATRMHGGRIVLPERAPRPGVRFALMRRTLEIARPIYHEGEFVGTLYLASDLSEWRDDLRRDAVIAACIVAASILAALALTPLLARRIASPIVRLAELADRVRLEKDYSLRTAEDPASPREIGGLMSALNEMLAEIERRDEKLKQHGEDLRHLVEARTAELRLAKQAAETILDTAGEGIFGLNADGIATFINASAARLLGYAVDDLIGLRLHDVIHPDADWSQCGVCRPVVEPLVRAGRVDVFLTRDGRRFPVEYTSSTMRGAARGVVVTFRDITERRAVERLKDEFVSTVSHELRTPLTSIRGALGLLSSGMLGGGDARSRRMLEIALANTDRLVRLINDILDLERISSGRVELNRTVTTAADVMRDAVQVVQAVADRASVAIVTEPDHTLLWIDRDRIVQTLTNLLGNAVKFSSSGAVVRLTGSAKDDAFTFTIADDGRGIPQEKLEQIFERFQQVDASDCREKGGSGLGLAICRSIVAAHGGRIWAESAMGQGSTFRFTVPTAAAGAAPDTAPAADLVLVCDEEAERIAAILEQRGRRAAIVADAASILERVADGHIGAVIYGAPIGDAVFVDLHDAARAHAVPLILVAQEQPAAFGAFADRGVAWVSRPFEPADLFGALDVTARNVQEHPVLIVEDDEDLVRIIAMSLESHGLHTLPVTSGVAAIAACRRVAPSAVILDIGLPDVDGFAVVDWMRRRSGLRDTPLIIYSASDLDPEDQERLRLGRTVFLTKSRCTFAALERCVLSLLRGGERKERVDAA